MALLHLAGAWARAAGRDIIVLTVDHGLRPEAASEAQLVAEASAALGLSHRTLRWQAPEPVQAEARRARHALLAGALREAGGETLLVGHTLNDQFETFLLRARQGSRWFGLAGMDLVSVSPVWPEGRGVRLVRPVLGVRRAVLRVWLQDRGAPWCEDPSNEDPGFERVRMRAWLAAAPQLTARLARVLAGLAALRRAELKRLATLLETHVQASPDGLVRLVAPGEIPAETLARLTGLLIQAAAGHDRPAPSEALAALASDAQTGGPSAARTLAGAWIAREGKSLVFARDPGLVDRQAPNSGGIWDGRFEVGTGARDMVSDHPMARRSLPSGGPPARSLVGERLAARKAVWDLL